MTPWHHVTPMFMFFWCTSGCPRKLTRWQKFMDSLKLDERVDFEQGDIGLAGGRGKVRVNLPTICSNDRVKTALKGSSLNGFKVLKFLGFTCVHTPLHTSQKPYFLSSVGRNRRFSASKCQNWMKSRTKCFFGASNFQAGRSFLRFAWQAQYLEACK